MNLSILKLLQSVQAELKPTLESRNLHFRIYTAENKIKDLETGKSLRELRSQAEDIKHENHDEHGGQTTVI